MEANTRDKLKTAAEDATRKLKEAVVGTKEDTIEPVQRKPPEVVLNDGDANVEGRPKLKGGEKWDVSTGKESAVGEKEEQKAKTDEEKDVELELNSILKRSPSTSFPKPLLPTRTKPANRSSPTVIIFSKSYCPYSKKAKLILLDKYLIVPAPFVVELDQHPMGPALQATLEKMTGRRTVPNVLISGKSIGGGDDVELLDRNDELVGKVKSMGGKRITEAKLRES